MPRSWRSSAVRSGGIVASDTCIGVVNATHSGPIAGCRSASCEVDGGRPRKGTPGPLSWSRLALSQKPDVRGGLHPARRPTTRSRSAAHRGAEPHAARLREPPPPRRLRSRPGVSWRDSEDAQCSTLLHNCQARSASDLASSAWLQESRAASDALRASTGDFAAASAAK